MKSQFETTAHHKEFAEHLKNKKIPLKFAYSGSAVDTYNKLVSRASYHHAVTSKLEQFEFIADLLKKDVINLIEIGPGDGRTSINLIHTLLSQGIISIKQYIGIDFSKKLLQVSKNRIKKFYPKLPIKVFAKDIEDEKIEPLELPTININALFLIGNTLGNVENPKTTLNNIRKMLRSKDVFVLGVSLKQKNRNFDYLSDYMNNTFFDAVLEPLKMAGINVQRNRLHFEFDKSIAGVIGYYNPDGNAKKGKIRCFISRRFTVDNLENLLKNVGFKILNNSISDDNRTCIITMTRK